MNDIGALTAYLAMFAGLAVAAWGAIGGLQRFSNLSERKVAMIAAGLGTIGGVIIQGAGFASTPEKASMWPWAASAFFGLLAAFAGAGATSLNVLSAMKKKPEA